MTTNAAQDEYNDLMASQRTRLSSHPEDASSISDSEDRNVSTTTSSSTLVGSSRYTSSKPSKTSLRSTANPTLRSSTYNDDSSDADSDLDNAASRRKATPYYIPNNHGYNENTGPKGVIADARAFERERRVGNKTTYVRTEDMVLPKMQHLRVDGQTNEHRSVQQLQEGEDEDEEDEEADEDDFMRRWREKRGDELRTGTWSGINTAGGRKGRFGKMRTVDAMGFLDALEQAKGTVVVVYVFSEESSLSEGYHAHLEDLAAKYADVKFVALHVDDAEMEPAGVPALLAYRDGEQIASLTPLKDEVPFTCNVVASLEETLRSRGIL